MVARRVGRLARLVDANSIGMVAQAAYLGIGVLYPDLGNGIKSKYVNNYLEVVLCHAPYVGVVVSQTG